MNFFGKYMFLVVNTLYTGLLITNVGGNTMEAAIIVLESIATGTFL